MCGPNYNSGHHLVLGQNSLLTSWAKGNLILLPVQGSVASRKAIGHSLTSLSPPCGSPHPTKDDVTASALRSRNTRFVFRPSFSFLAAGPAPLAAAVAGCSPVRLL